MSHEPTRACDLVMKGGITSGVVYPPLVLELARDHRFVNIGGTSAGAIAAGLTAAAEYGRQGGGFELLAEVPDMLQEHLLDLFQPHPKHARTFRKLLKVIRSGKRPGVIRTARLVRPVYRSFRRLRKTEYGLCPGTTQKGASHPGLTDWLNVRIERLAGRLAEDDGPLPDEPLTFGHLAARGITLRTVTTDLSSKNPVLLPFRQRTWMFKDGELTRLLPENVAEWLRRVSTPMEKNPGFFQLPEANDLPVLLAVRASLSFPILFSALPLYRFDYSLRLDPKAQETPQLCWLSDGGITSNFPIHLFDDPFPSRPTFGISLDGFDERRHHKSSKVPEGRVYLPKKAGQGMQRPVDAIGGPFAFFAAILNAARNWQDELQSVLPGYRERIAHIALTSDEGGLNLEMKQGVVARLSKYGELAGKELAGFDLEEHRWRRFLTAYAAFEESFEAMADSWNDGFRDAVETPRDGSYPPGPGDREEIVARVDELMKVASAWRSDPLRERWGGKKGMPRPRTHLKQVPLVQAAGDSTSAVRE